MEAPTTGCSIGGSLAAHIDAGYALNGWWLCTPITPTGPPSRGREPDVPWITGSPRPAVQDCECP